MSVTDIVTLLFGTIRLRPYVFAFLLLYLVLGSRQIGWLRIVVWTATGYCVAFAAEYTSTHCGIPFGYYSYIPITVDRELWIGGVPFMDSLSFTFLSYTGFSCAWQLLAARYAAASNTTKINWDHQYRSIRRAPGVLVLGAFITTLADVIIDPVALMGDRWFLGRIYAYRHNGFFFGVPFTNFIGWFVVSAAIIGLNQLFDRLLPVQPPQKGKMQINCVHLGGFGLFLLIAVFNLAVAFWLELWLLVSVGVSLVACFSLLSWRLLRKMMSAANGRGTLGRHENLKSLNL